MQNSFFNLAIFNSPIAVVSFWLFIAIVVIASLIYSYARNLEVQKTIRMAIEKNIKLDPAVINSLVTGKSSKSEDYLIGGICSLAVGIGLPILGYFLARIAPVAFYPIAGSGILVGLIGISLTVIGLLIRQQEKISKNKDN